MMGWSGTLGGSCRSDRRCVGARRMRWSFREDRTASSVVGSKELATREGIARGGVCVSRFALFEISYAYRCSKDLSIRARFTHFSLQNMSSDFNPRRLSIAILSHFTTVLTQLEMRLSRSVSLRMSLLKCRSLSLRRDQTRMTSGNLMPRPQQTDCVKKSSPPVVTRSYPAAREQ
jgi:hypothetical protein